MDSWGSLLGWNCDWPRRSPLTLHNTSSTIVDGGRRSFHGVAKRIVFLSGTLGFSQCSARGTLVAGADHTSPERSSARLDCPMQGLVGNAERGCYARPIQTRERSSEQWVSIRSNHPSQRHVGFSQQSTHRRTASLAAICSWTWPAARWNSTAQHR